MNHLQNRNQNDLIQTFLYEFVNTTQLEQEPILKIIFPGQVDISLKESQSNATQKP